MSIDPVVVSGLGGSGTRVAALMCRALGIDMGSDVNAAHDELLFTLLLKRPRLLDADALRPPSARVSRVLEVYEQLRGRRDASLPAVACISELQAAAVDMVRDGSERSSASRRTVWVGRRIAALGRRDREPATERWGWKEPTAHLYLEHLLARYPAMRYVHVVRDPADYAVKPHNQFRLWGPLLGVPLPDRRDDLAMQQLRYWVRANQRALTLPSAVGVPVHLVRLEDASRDPQSSALALAEFLGVVPDEAQLSVMRSVVEPSSSLGRGAGSPWVDHLNEGEVDFVRETGYLAPDR